MTAYPNNLEHLRDELRRLDILLEHAVSRFRARRSDDQLSDFRGLYISDTEVDELMTPQTQEDETARLTLDGRLAERRAEILQRVRETQDAGVSLRLPYLGAVFGLSMVEMDVLLLALAPELELRYQKLYAYLQDDVSRRRPSIDLALRLLCLTPAERNRARDLFIESAPLLDHSLIILFEENTERPAPLLNRSLKVDDRIVEFLRGSDEPDQRLKGSSGHARRIIPTRDASDLVLSESLFESLGKIVLLARGGQALRCLLHGPAGSGKKVFAEAACRKMGRTLLILDLSALIKSQAQVQALVRAAFREAALYGSALYLDGWHDLTSGEAATQAARIAVEHQLARFSGLVFLGSREPWQPDHHTTRDFLSLEVPRPDERLRRELWRVALHNGTPVAPDVDQTRLSNAFRFTGGQIERALAQARTQAWLRAGEGYELTMADLLAGCRMQSARQLVSFARKIEPKRVWSDLVLPTDTLAQLKEFCQQVRYRVKVYDEWGFGQRLSLGKGLLALFTGSSGTGKTLSAEILARELSLDLYRVDLSCVVSKYIGETEKNLSRVFDDAQEANAILFFDEADALFGKRSEVKDAHDRYANIEISYLLQRVEEYEGAIILATNLSNNIDDAFLRRMHFSIEFPFPAETHRLRIWRGIFPPQVPLGEGLDFEFLARKFKIAGGNIKNVALGAAFLAAQNGGTINMEHLILALKREYQKLGKVCDRTEFEKYYELVR